MINGTFNGEIKLIKVDLERQRLWQRSCDL